MLDLPTLNFDFIRNAWARRSLWVPGLVVAWLLFIGLNLFGVIDNGITLAHSTIAALQAPQQPSNPFGSEAYAIGPQPGIPFALNLWGLWAGLYFGLVIVPNRRGMKNWKRIAIGGGMLAMMIGRVVLAVLVGPLSQIAAVPTWLALLLMPNFLLLGGMATIGIIGAGVLGLFSFFIGIPVAIFNQIFAFERSVNIYRYSTRGLSSYIVRFVYWLRNEALPAAPPDESKGARFAVNKEIAALHAPKSPDAMAFGHLGNPLALKTDKHVLVMASTRSGKGVTLIIPHLLRYGGSAFVLDPKGENARATGRRRERINDKVHYLDPFGISGKPQSRFNPLSRFTPENMEAESKALAAALFLVSDRDRDHWNAAGQQLLAAIILYVYAAREIPAGKKDLPSVRRILLGGVDMALEAMTKSDAAGGLLRDLALSFLKTPEKEFGSVVSTAQRQTEILDNPFITACLSATGKGQGARGGFQGVAHRHNVGVFVPVGTEIPGVQ
jgi:hypothetical protein